MTITRARRGLLTLLAVAGIMLAGTTAAQAAPSPTAPSPAGPSPASGSSVDDILRTNPQARLIQPNVVEVRKGVAVLVPPKGGWAKTAAGKASPLDYCTYKWTCMWEAAFWNGFGHGLAFYDCLPPNSIIDLGAYRYPDFVWVGTGASGPKWNDRLSSEVNNQTPGAKTTFYNWEGWWRAMGSTLAPYWHDDWSRRTGWNDVVDGVDPC